MLAVLLFLRVNMQAAVCVHKEQYQEMLCKYTQSAGNILAVALAVSFGSGFHSGRHLICCTD